MLRSIWFLKSFSKLKLTLACLCAQFNSSSESKRMVRFKWNHSAHSENEWHRRNERKIDLNDYNSVYIRLFYKIERASLFWTPFKFPKRKFVVLLKPFVLYLNGLELITICLGSIWFFFSRHQSTAITHRHEINSSKCFE